MPYNVLVVDDNRIMREMVARTVRMCPLEIGEILFAGNGQDALTMMGEHLVDVVLLDVNMPVMNGEQFLTKLRADPALRATLVVVVSTESSMPRVERLKGLGAGFVHKPFRPEELAAAIDGLVNATSATRSP